MPVTTTDLLDRYLHAVKFWLPGEQQHDILAELAEDLHSQTEERESSLGRPLTEDELVSILKKRGSPMTVAGAFLPEQRLINPALLPVYRLVLKIVLLWVLLPLFVIALIGPLVASGHPERVVLLFIWEGARTALMVLGIVTAVFALTDRYHVKIKSLDHWDPRKLPRVPAAQETSARWNHLAGFIFGMFAVVCWVYLMRDRTEFAIPGGPRIVLGTLWKYIYWPVVGLTLTTASVDLLAFLYPCWNLVRARVRLGLDGANLLGAMILLTFTNAVEIAGAGYSAADLAKVNTWINASIQITLVAIAIAAIADAVVQVRLLLRAGHAKSRTAAGALYT